MDYQFNQNRLGCHFKEKEGQKIACFRVWAPHAFAVELIGDFNFWDGKNHPLHKVEKGIWEISVEGLEMGNYYKYRIFSELDEEVREKADPYALCTELMPKSASVVFEDNYQWKDKRWMKTRHKKNALKAPISIYEVHLGSWKKDKGDSLTYRQHAEQLVPYVKEMGFTHVELLPITEHPYYPSWGYLTSSYFAPTSRFGNPDDLKFLIDSFHRAGIGVILDWVPGHFPNDAFALAKFDGSYLYEHPDKRKGFHKGWNSLVFNYEREEVRNFLIDSALFWLENYHLDGLRVDAVTSMIYLDYGREKGEWEANEEGGNINLAAVQFLQELNSIVYSQHPDIQMIAEESTNYQGVSHPVDENGLGFGMKWMMGWMNDTLRYMKREPIYRKHHQDELSLSIHYAWNENFVLPFSHDEVVHGKASLVYKMPGDEWQKMAQLRLLLGYMFTHPGQKLLFMGSEFAQTSEWDFNGQLDWHLLEHEIHQQMQDYLKTLNHLYRSKKALQWNFSWKGFEWIDFQDQTNSVIIYLRKSKRQKLLVICHFNNQVLEDYQLGIPKKSKWREIFNSDWEEFGGSGIANRAEISTFAEAYHNRKNSIRIRIPALAILVLEPIKLKRKQKASAK